MLQIHRQTEKKTAGSQAGAGRTDCPPSLSLHRPRRAAAREEPILTAHLFFALLCLRRAPSHPSVWCAQSSSLALRLQRHADSSRIACAPARRHGAGGTGSSACGTLSRKARTARRAARRCCWRKSPAHCQVYRHSAQCGLRRGGRPQVGNTSTGWAHRTRWPACGRPCC